MQLHSNKVHKLHVMHVITAYALHHKAKAHWYNADPVALHHKAEVCLYSAGPGLIPAMGIRTVEVTMQTANDGSDSW